MSICVGFVIKLMDFCVVQLNPDAFRTEEFQVGSFVALLLQKETQALLWNVQERRMLDLAI